MASVKIDFSPAIKSRGKIGHSEHQSEAEAIDRQRKNMLRHQHLIPLRETCFL